MPKDRLSRRLDFYKETIIFYNLENKATTAKVVSATDIALALLSHIPMSSGLLPEGALWWRRIRDSEEIALWRPPKVWPVALMVDAYKPPIRLKLPMPGLIFVCSPARPPFIYATKRHPLKPSDVIYHAPLYNIYNDGRSCPGTHKYPEDINDIPESFFLAFFSMEASPANRSKKYPNDLFKLWKEIDGKPRYPTKDLVPAGKVKDIIKGD